MKSLQVIEKHPGNQAMAHNNTVFSQLLKLISRHEFETLAIQHHSGRSFRTASRWSQFVTLSLAQLTGRNSLRDIVENMSAQAHRLYHLGSATLSRHVGLNHNGYLPEFVTITDVKNADITVGRTLSFPKGSIVAIDKGYNDYSWYNQLTGRGIFFVTRLKSNASHRVVHRHSVL
jgi:hypothetical protein